MKVVRILLVLIFSITLLFGADVVEYFRARSISDYVRVEWKSIDEHNLLRYEIERSASGQPFKVIHTEYSQGISYTYSYDDKDVYRVGSGDKTQGGSTYYTYRMKFIKNDYTYSYSNSVDVTHNVSGIQRTWGMIKEMFR